MSEYQTLTKCKSMQATDGAVAVVDFHVIIKRIVTTDDGRLQLVMETQGIDDDSLAQVQKMPDLCLSCRWSRWTPQGLACVNNWRTGRRLCLGYEYEPGTDAYETAYNGLQAVENGRGIPNHYPDQDRAS